MSGKSPHLRDAVALFDIARSHGCASLHVKTGVLEMFVAFEKGVVNPMAARPTIPAPPAETGTWTAPHLATLLGVATVGELVRKGETFARIGLLDEEIALQADRTAIVTMPLATPGALLEFDAPIAAWCARA